MGGGKINHKGTKGTKVNSSLLWALVVMFVMFPGILPGVIALGLHNLGILGRLMAEINENLAKPPLEALKAQGTPGLLLFLYGIFPMNLPRFLAYIC